MRALIVQQVDLLKTEALELKDIRSHWIEWRADWERKLAANEIQFLRNAADLQGAFQHRVTLMEVELPGHRQERSTRIIWARSTAPTSIFRSVSGRTWRSRAASMNG